MEEINYDKMCFSQEIKHKWYQMTVDERDNYNGYDSFRRHVHQERIEREKNNPDKFKLIGKSQKYLELAIEHDDYDLVKLAIDKCPKEYLEDILFDKYKSLENISDVRIFDLLFDSGMEIDESDNRPLVVACLENKIEIIRSILERTERPDMKAGSPDSLYRLSVKNDNYELFKLLISFRSIPDYESDHIEQMLEYDQVHYLIYMRHGIDINPPERSDAQTQT